MGMGALRQLTLREHHGVFGLDHGRHLKATLVALYGAAHLVVDVLDNVLVFLHITVAGRAPGWPALDPDHLCQGFMTVAVNLEVIRR